MAKTQTTITIQNKDNKNRTVVIVSKSIEMDVKDGQLVPRESEVNPALEIGARAG